MLDRDLHVIAASDAWSTQFSSVRTKRSTGQMAAWKELGVDTRALERGLAGSTLTRSESAWTAPDGITRWLRWAVVPWRDADGNVGGLLIWADDITDRKRAQQQLRARQQLATAIFEQSPYAIALIRKSDRVIVSVNPAFLEMFECTREQVVGKPTSDISVLDDLESPAALQAVFDTEHGVRDFAGVHRTRTGELRVISLNLQPVTIDDSDHVLATMCDVTELKQAKLTARLYEQAKELDEVKTRFFASVSHELRTPLTLILAGTERLLASPLADAALRRDLAVIARNARTLLEHVNDLLDISKLEARQVQVEYVEADVSQLVRFVAGHFETLATEHGMELAIDAEDDVRAQVDSDQIKRVLLNLLSNAFKFTGPGGRVRVTLRGLAAQFRIEVADSGPGVPAELREVIFEPFRQLEGGPTRRFGGTGLGLAIARELVVLHRGTIAVEDAPEGGALFVVTLPREAAEGAPIVRSAAVRDTGIREAIRSLAEVAPIGRAPLGERGPLVLVVEDNPDMNRFLCEQLAIDHRVEVAYDGREGLSKALALRPDLVLTDIMMPAMSGDELVAAIRSHRELDLTPIVVLTVRTEDAVRVQLLRQGAQDYLTKPFSIEELRVRVDNLIARKRAEERSIALQRQLEDVTAASNAVSEAVASLPETSVRAVLHTIALKAQALTAAEYVAVGIGNDPESPFDPWVVVGMDPRVAAAIGRSPRPIGVLGLADREHVLRLRDVREHASFGGLPPGHPELTSFVAAPIMYQGKHVGSLYLANKRDAEEFGEQDERMVLMLAGRVGVAIETARLFRAEGLERRWLQAVIDQMPEAVVMVDARGKITSQNRAALALSWGDLIELRRPTGELVSLDDNPIMQAIRREQTTYSLELVARRADGRDLPVLVSATPIHMADGQLAGATMVLQDISPLKELDRLREEWASIVAHDLQQPINAIVLLADMLLRGPLDPKERDRLDRVRALSFRLSRMVADLSDASQLESHRLVIAHERMDLQKVVREFVAREPSVMGRARVGAGNGRLPIDGDRGRLEQVLSNLLSNAVKYGAPGAEIDVELDELDGAAHVEVKNRGAGIPPEELPDLFKRFVRARETKTTIRGSGLGLYIAKGIIEAHGGHMWVESVPERSTTFHFTIPLAHEAAG
jgi:PAS domain S-box-containing protein